MSTLTFTVYGHPEPAGSKKTFIPKGHTRPIVVDANPKAKPWKQMLHETALATTKGVLFIGPVMVELYFHLARPRGHYGSGRNNGTLKASSPAYPTTRPDVDKLSRAVLDGLTGAVWRDDAQVVWKVASKGYGVPERVDIHVRSLPLTVGARQSHPVVEGGLAA